MLLSILLVFLYTTLTSFVWTPKVPFIKNKILKISFSWFLGYFFSTIIVFLIAAILVYFTNDVLKKASLIYLITLLFIFLLNSKKIILPIFKYLKSLKLNKSIVADIFVLLVCLVISLALFLPHLKLEDGKIYRSVIYWDIQWHMPLIQNFTLGDNFPPENESFSGFPQTYHYFWGVSTGIYSTLGLGLVGAINFISIVSFFFLQTTVYGVSQELFKSRSAGFIAIPLNITTASLRFLYYEPFRQKLSLLETIKTILKSNGHPGFSSMITGNPFGYNGQMFNVFYFIAERQIIPAIVYLLFAVIIFINRKHLSFFTSIIYGIILGLFFQWHLFVTVALIPSLCILFILGRERKKTFGFLLGFGLIVGLHYTYFLTLMRSDWFYPDIVNYPQINFNFPTMEEYYPFSFFNAIKYYLFAYGLKIPFILLGLYYFWKNHHSLLLSLVSIIISLFVLTNTIQLSPASIYDNHKWLRPLNVILDLVVAFAFVKFFNPIKSGLIKKNHLFFRTLAVYSFILLTLGGFIELMSFINSKPKVFFANFNSDIVLKIKEKTSPKAAFLTEHQKEVHLAGRRAFLGNNLGGDLRLNKAKRASITQAIYSSGTKKNFCLLTSRYKIDFVEFEKNPQELSQFNNPKYFEATTEDGKKLYYLDTKKTCQF